MPLSHSLSKTLFAMTFMVSLALAMPGVMATDITSCDQTLLSNDVYLIQNDIDMDLDLWCWFVGDNTTVDCQGHTLNCNGSYWFGQTGSIVDNVTIKNCVVNYSSDGDVDLSQGLWFGGTGHNMLFENLTLVQNYPVGSSFGYGLVSMYGNYAYGDSQNIIIRDITTIGQINMTGGRLIEILNGRNISLDNMDFNIFGSSGRGFNCFNCSAVITNVNGITDDVGIAVYDNSSVNVTGVNIDSGYENVFCYGLGCYIEINDLIGSSSNNNAIYLYNSNGIINNVTLNGNNGTTNIGINIIGADVIIDDFEIYNFSRGIMLYNGDGYSEVKNGFIHDIYETGSSGHSIVVYNYNNTLIENVEINRTYGGLIYAGISKWSENHILKNITETNAGLSGVSGSSVIGLGVKNLTVSGCSFGYNPFWDTAIVDNYLGVYYTNDNILFYNNTYDVTNGVWINISGTINFNDSAYGNSWSDYTGCDVDGDGIGETPYLVNASSGIYDYLPLTDNICPSNDTLAITIHSPENISYSDLLINLDVSANGTTDQWYYDINGSNQTFTPNITLDLAENNYHLIVWGRLGTDWYSDDVWFTVDRTAPILTMHDPQNISYEYNTSIPVNVTFTDEYSELLNWSYYINNETAYNFGLDDDFSGYLEIEESGLYYFNVSGVDDAGNIGYADVWFTIESVIELSNVTELCTPEIISMCEPFDDWTKAECIDSNTLRKTKECVISWSENTTDYICHWTKTQDFNCDNGCYENITQIGAGCSPTDMELMGMVGIIFIIFIVAISFLLGGKRKRR